MVSVEIVKIRLIKYWWLFIAEMLVAIKIRSRLNSKAVGAKNGDGFVLRRFLIFFVVFSFFFWRVDLCPRFVWISIGHREGRPSVGGVDVIKDDDAAASGSPDAPPPLPLFPPAPPPSAHHPPRRPLRDAKMARRTSPLSSLRWPWHTTGVFFFLLPSRSSGTTHFFLSNRWKERQRKIVETAKRSTVGKQKPRLATSLTRRPITHTFVVRSPKNAAKPNTFRRNPVKPSRAHCNAIKSPQGTPKPCRTPMKLGETQSHQNPEKCRWKFQQRLERKPVKPNEIHYNLTESSTRALRYSLKKAGAKRE